MANINFETGTIVPSSWLNDVNDLVYYQNNPAILPLNPSDTLNIKQSGVNKTVPISEIQISNAEDISYTATPSDAVVRNVKDKLTEELSFEDFGCVGDGVTDDSVNMNRAWKYFYDLGIRGIVYGTPNKVYLVRNLLPYDGVTVDLRNSTLKLLPVPDGDLVNAIISHPYQLPSFAPDPLVHGPDDYWIAPNQPKYSGGFNSFDSGTSVYPVGTDKVTLAIGSDFTDVQPGRTAALLGFDRGTHTAQSVYERVVIDSVDEGTRTVTFRWPITKTLVRSDVVDAYSPKYFGMNIVPTGYVQGIDFCLQNGTIDSGLAESTYTILHYGLKCSFKNLLFLGHYFCPLGVKGGKILVEGCRFEQRYASTEMPVHIKNPYSLDVSSTDITFKGNTWECSYSAWPAANHNGEYYSFGKFFNNVFEFPVPRSDPYPPGLYGLGAIGFMFIGNTIINCADTMVIGGGPNPDGSPYSQIWVNNYFFGSVKSIIQAPLQSGLAENPGGANQPTVGAVLIANNYIQCSSDVSIFPNAALINGAQNCIIVNNYFDHRRSDGLVNFCADIDPLTCVIRGNIGIADLETIELKPSDNNALSGGVTLTTSGSCPVLSFPAGGGGVASFVANRKSKQGKIYWYARAYWANLGAGSGDIQYAYDYVKIDLGESISTTPYFGGSQTLTAAAQDILFTGVPVLGVHNYPVGDNMEETIVKISSIPGTLANAAGLVKLELFAVPASGN